MKWARYIDDDTIVVMKTNHLVLIKRDDHHSPNGHVVESLPMSQQDALVTAGHVLIAFGGGFRHGKLTPEKTSFVDISSGHLSLLGEIEVPLVKIVESAGGLVGEVLEGAARYRIEGVAGV